ncbi:TRAP transporter large permease [Stutzerimonas urumqiensis]|uniref:TRAP transporter large permease n=1 Tax=Stutzerimonas urumqiensis TaxID=638269 RepID=UPI000EABEA67|nr:TRAP transporter large permease subunit [Stutzerimonas urumqiensis]
MDYLIIATTLLVSLFVLLAGGVWVALALLGVGITGMEFFGGAPAGSILATTSWAASASWTLTALPLFIWMGEILYRTRLSQDMFRGLSPWVRGLPGRLLHVNVLGCGIFAAVSGSSAATAATIGRISLPELKQRGYPDAIAMGSLAGAGTLGLLIPPSIMMIVYGVAAQVSISRLFIAGLVPGLMLLTIFSGYLVLWSLFNRRSIPDEPERLGFVDRLRRAKLLIPVGLLIVAVIGSIYGGFATATEAAAVGVVGALVIALVSGSLTRETFMASLLGAVCTSCMIFFILLGAHYLTAAMSFTGLPAELADWIVDRQLSPYLLLLALTLLFVVLGCFLDGISIILLTTAVIMPAVEAAGIDLLWFGIFLILIVEMAQITPPVGFNLFVIQSLTGRDLGAVARASLPFFGLIVLAAIIITAFPDIVLFLPQMVHTS